MSSAAAAAASSLDFASATGALLAAGGVLLATVGAALATAGALLAAMGVPLATGGALPAVVCAWHALNATPIIKAKPVALGSFIFTRINLVVSYLKYRK